MTQRSVPAVRAMIRVAGVLSFILAALALGPGRAGAALHGNPFAAGPWWVDREWNPARDAQQWLFARGRTRDARLLGMIANTTKALWWPYTQDEQQIRSYLDRVVRQSRPRTVPVLVTENLPSVGCADNYTGAPNQATFRRWVDAFARGIGAHRVIVVVESDGVARSACLRGARRNALIRLIAYEVMALAPLRNAAIYIDAGASDWAPANQIAGLLRHAGIAHARGFALNTTHYDWTHNNVVYGRQVSRRLRGKPFVINTALNGRGPLQGRRYHVWCNPSGRALGPLPTLHTGDRRIDAFYWLGTPGTSDGRCGNDRGSMIGPPVVGTFWLYWALQVSRNALQARDFPRYRG